MSSKLVQAMAELDEDLVLEEVRSQLNNGVPALEIIGQLQEGMGIVGKKFENKEYFLSELLVSAEIFNEASSILGVDENTEGVARYGNFVIGTIYEDIHDIGKNIVTAVMKSNGFNVIDLGVDVPTEKFIDAIKEYKPIAVGISCLLTTCFDNIKQCIQAITDAGLRDGIKILIGGGPVDEATCRYVNADAYCTNAQQGVEYCKKLLGVE